MLFSKYYTTLVKAPPCLSTFRVTLSLNLNSGGLYSLKPNLRGKEVYSSIMATRKD